MDFDLLILDFDGTFTDVEKEAGPFVDAYLQDVRQLLGEDIEADWNRALETIRSAPNVYGWTYGGHVVAPGNADPYLRATVVMNMLFDERGLYPDPEERTDVLQNLYFTNYPKAATVFRSDAKDVVEALLGTDKPVFVVTNSATDAVLHKLEKLAPKGAERLSVRGNAKKYIVVEPPSPDACFTELPAEQKLPGLERPVYLRRGHYYDVLKELWTATGAAKDRTLIAGDIYELDLAMPSNLGVHVHLVAGKNTPAFEREAVTALPRGQVSTELGAVLGRLD